MTEPYMVRMNNLRSKPEVKLNGQTISMFLKILVILLLLVTGGSLLASERENAKQVANSGIELTIDPKVFIVNWSLPDPIPRLKASLRVFNLTPEPRKFVLGSSSCPFDLVITDESGNVVFHLNATRGCTRDLLIVTLTNEEKVFEQVVRLRDKSGKPLNAGTYRIQAKGTSRLLGEPVEFTVEHMR